MRRVKRGQERRWRGKPPTAMRVLVGRKIGVDEWGELDEVLELDSDEEEERPIG